MTELETKGFEAGKAAFAKGLMCIPAHDPAVAGLLKGLTAKETIAMLSAWNKGWTEANLASPVEDL